jgi:hypothetical protein
MANAGDIIRKAREQAKQSGKNEIDVIRDLSQAEVNNPTTPKAPAQATPKQTINNPTNPLLQNQPTNPLQQGAANLQNDANGKKISSAYNQPQQGSYLEKSIFGGTVELKKPIDIKQIGFGENDLSPLNLMAGGSVINVGKSMIAKLTAKSAGSTIAKAAAGQTVKKSAAIATNTVNAAKTTSWLSKIAGATVKSPAFVVSAIVGAIGSYPFAGFLKEEALQTLGMATKTAIENGDIAGAEKAYQQQQELLNPDLWKQILGAVPFANTMSALEDFYKAAANKNEQDRVTIEQMKTNTTKAQNDKIANEKYYSDLRKEQENYEAKKRKDMEDYYASIDEKKRIADEKKKKDESDYYKKLQDERDKRDEEKRKENLAEEKRQEEKWRKIREEQDARDKAEREQKLLDDLAEEEKWRKIREAQQKAYEDSGKSNLQFGII